MRYTESPAKGDKIHPLLLYEFHSLENQNYLFLSQEPIKPLDLNCTESTANRAPAENSELIYVIETHRKLYCMDLYVCVTLR